MRLFFKLASSRKLASLLLICVPGLAHAQTQAPAADLERERLLAAIFTNLENVSIQPGLVKASHTDVYARERSVEIRVKDNCNIEYRRLTKHPKGNYALERRTLNLTRLGAVEPMRLNVADYYYVVPGFEGRGMLCSSDANKNTSDFIEPLDCRANWTDASIEVDAPENQIPAVMSKVINAEKAYLTKYCPSKLAPLIKEVSEQLGERSPMAGGSPPAFAPQVTIAVNQATGIAPASIIDALAAGDDAALRKAMRANLPSYNCNADDGLLRCTDGNHEVKATAAKKAFFFHLEVSKNPDRFPQSRPVFELIDRLGSAIGLSPTDINGCWQTLDNRIFVEKRAGLKIACQTSSQFTKEMALTVEPDTSF